MIFCTLNKLMKEHNVTQTKVAEVTGITRPTLLQLIKNENHGIKYEVIENLCSFFDVKMSELLVHSKYDISYIESKLEVDEELIKRTEGEIERITITTFIEVDDYVLPFEGEYFFSPIGLDMTLDIKGVQLVCSLEPSAYDTLIKYIEDKNKLELYFDTFNIRERIVKDLDLHETLINRIDFSLERIEEVPGIDQISYDIEKLSEEEKKELYSQKFNEVMEILSINLDELIKKQKGD